MRQTEKIFFSTRDIAKMTDRMYIFQEIIDSASVNEQLHTAEDCPATPKAPKFGQKSPL